MTITKIDNIFNVIAQNMPELNFYHFGWVQDINEQNLKNNFNLPTNNVDTLNYPAVYAQCYEGDLIVPISSGGKYGYIYNIELRFVKPMQNYNDQSENTNNTSELWSQLQLIAVKFLGYFNLSMRENNNKYLAKFIKFSFDSEAYAPDLAELKVSFVLGYDKGFDNCLIDLIDQNILDQISGGIAGVNDLISIENIYNNE